MSCSGPGWPMAFRKARVDLAFFAMKMRSPRAASIVAGARADCAFSPPSPTGIRYSVPEWRSDTGDAFLSQHGGEPRQRHSDKRARVLAPDVLDENDAEPLDFGAPRTVVGLLSGK